MTKKILMVCLGNICRSPLAHGILQRKIVQHNLDWEVDSAGTASYHQGSQPDSRSIAIANENGIDISFQKARQFTADDLVNFDLILAMDASNYNNISKLITDPEQSSKIKMILNYVHPGENRQVPDPYYGGGFDKVYRMLEKACEEIVKSEV